MDILKIAVAGLLHDVGKFAQNCVELDPGYVENNQDLYQPFNRKGGYFTHKHALYTAVFIEQNESIFPEELVKGAIKTGREDDSFINLAAKHHKPETPIQWIIAEADRLSSGIDRVEFEKGEEISFSEYAQTRLLPIFERLLRTDKTFDKVDDFKWRYRLRPVSATNIFPVEVGKNDSRISGSEEYHRLFSEFCDDIKNLGHRNHPYLWVQHLDSLYRIYTSYIPAARVGKVIHDVSLYDHSRSTAALASAMYLYHLHNDTLNEESIRNRSEEKFLLVSGDFYGIQEFIFKCGGEERHHRAKLLRGRSLMVSLMVELAAELICKEIGLTFLSVFLSAAGKFHLIAPNTDAARKSVEKTSKIINEWLYRHFYGECAIGITTTPAAASSFVGGNFFELWNEHLSGLEETKYRRFDITEPGVINGYLDSFKSNLNDPLCPLCGRRPSSVTDDSYLKKSNEETGVSCAICRDQILLGTKIVRKENLVITDNAGKGELKEPIFGVYQLRFTRGIAGELAKSGRLLKLIDTNVLEDGSCPRSVTFVPINGYVPTYTESDKFDDRILAGGKSEKRISELIDMTEIGDPQSLHHIASKALNVEENGSFRGVSALGVLKADVDNLGAVFSCGLPKELYTISRLCTVSRQMNNFFSLYLPYALKNERNGRFSSIYTVFAGGDDLFLIGPWNRMQELALFLRKKFSEYTCENPMLTFSAGISVHKPYTPIHHLADEGERALEAAKAARDEKNMACMFGYAVTWDDLERLWQISFKLKEWLETGLLSRSVLYRLDELRKMAEEEFQILNASGNIPISRLHCLKWRPLLGYLLVRNIKGNVAYEIIREITEWLSNYRGAFALALWSLLYETRRQKI